MATTKKIKFSIRHYPENGEHNVSDIDVGPLLGGLTEEPSRLARDAHGDGSIRIEVERKHEWEYLFGLVIVGSAIFAKSVLETLGKRLGNWIADQVEKSLKKGGVEARGIDATPIMIDPDNPAVTRDRFQALIEKAADQGGTLVILFPW